MERWKENAALQESDARRLGCAEAMGRNSLGFSLLARESAEETGGHTWERIDLCRDLQKYGRKALLHLYIRLALPSASLVS